MRQRFVDPFFPNRPVDDPGRFAGRVEQVDEVVDSLYQISNENPKHTIITGDRGIGKSSLLLQTKQLAEGNTELAERLNIDLGCDQYDFIVLWHDADHGQKPGDVSLGLLRELNGILRNLFNQIDLQLNIPGFLEVSQKSGETHSISELVGEFCDRLEKAGQKAKERGRDGVLLFIDELDRVDPESGIGSFFKLTSEKLNRRGAKNVAFFCAGITGAVQNLEKDHASISRTFRDIPIPRLTEEETESILTDGFDAVSMGYDGKVPAMVYSLAAGFPEPVHLLGSEMLSVEKGGKITVEDFRKAKEKVIGDVKKNKLASLLKKAGSGKYQLILDAMAKYDGREVPLDHISKIIGYEQNQYSSNMGTLRERGIIKRVDMGVYQFVDPLLKEYIRAFGVRSKSR
jgi:energy-coupling factor transporter ATP-binding protein EcfA2